MPTLLPLLSPTAIHLILNRAGMTPRLVFRRHHPSDCATSPQAVCRVLVSLNPHPMARKQACRPFLRRMPFETRSGQSTSNHSLSVGGQLHRFLSSLAQHTPSFLLLEASVPKSKWEGKREFPSFESSWPDGDCNARPGRRAGWAHARRDTYSGPRACSVPGEAQLRARKRPEVLGFGLALANGCLG